jgi:hypothetical protein
MEKFVAMVVKVVKAAVVIEEMITLQEEIPVLGTNMMVIIIGMLVVQIVQILLILRLLLNLEVTVVNYLDVQPATAPAIILMVGLIIIKEVIKVEMLPVMEIPILTGPSDVVMIPLKIILVVMAVKVEKVDLDNGINMAGKMVSQVTLAIQEAIQKIPEVILVVRVVMVVLGELRENAATEEKVMDRMVLMEQPVVNLLLDRVIYKAEVQQEQHAET